MMDLLIDRESNNFSLLDQAYTDNMNVFQWYMMCQRKTLVAKTPFINVQLFLICCCFKSVFFLSFMSVFRAMLANVS
jgi:hypothetical protein